MKPAVFLTVLRGIETFAEGLLRQGDVELVSMYEATYPLLDARTIPYRKFTDFYSEEHTLWAANEVDVRAGAIAAELQGPAMRACWPQYADDDATWKRLNHEITQLLRQDFFYQVVYLDALRRCAREMDLRLVIVQQDIARDTKTIIHGAHRLGIPSLHVLHGFPNGATNMHDECFADVVAVYSERSRAMFESFGMPPERIHITGNPEWDKHARPPAPGYRKAACEMLGVDPNRPIIMYAITYTHRFSKISATALDYVNQITAVVLRAFAELSRRHPDWQFVLRPHPHDQLGAKTLPEQARAAGLEKFWLDDKKSTAIFAITLAGVMVCTQSNLGIEAILAGKPVVNVVIDEFGHDVYYEGLGPLFLDEDAVIQVRTVEEVIPAIEAAVLDPATRQRLLAARPGTISRFNYRLDGKATERFSALALSIVEDYACYVAPVRRFPEFEVQLAQAVPPEAKRVLVAGRAASYVMDAMRDVRLLIDIEMVSDLPRVTDGVRGGGWHDWERRHPCRLFFGIWGLGSGENRKPLVKKAGKDAGAPSTPDPRPQSPDPERAPYDAIVLADPIPHSEEADEWLCAVRGLLTEEGSLIAAFRHGGNVEAADAVRTGHWTPPCEGMDASSQVGEYCRRGVELALSRCDLELERFCEIRNSAFAPEALRENAAAARLAIDGWVVHARKRVIRAWGLGPVREQARRRAEEANARGERLAAAGDFAGAVAKFAAALADWKHDGRYEMNLGVTLMKLERHDEAWDHLLAALHYDPCLQGARAALRAVAGPLGREREAARVLQLFGVDSA